MYCTESLLNEIDGGFIGKDFGYSAKCGKLVFRFWRVLIGIIICLTGNRNLMGKNL
jgi:hypothetical protein